MSNINEKRTFEEFGYTSSELKKTSLKLIYRICSICNKEELKRAYYVKFLNQNKCLDCSNKINAKKNLTIRSEKIKKFHQENNHPRLGKKHTEKSKMQMSETHKSNGKIISDETRLKLSIANTGIKNGFYGKKHSKESLKKMSEIQKRIARRGSKSNFYGKSYYAKCVNYIKNNGKVVKLKSSWEVKLAIFLDEKGVEWEYEAQYFPVTYEYEGIIINGTYTPDFFLETGEIIEVKGYWRKDAFVKFNAFKEQYPNIKIILYDLKKLKEVGIL